MGSFLFKISGERYCFLYWASQPVLFSLAKVVGWRGAAFV